MIIFLLYFDIMSPLQSTILLLVALYCLMVIYYNISQFQLHNRCASQLSPECSLGPHRAHVLPPTSICPTVLDRQRSVIKEKSKDKVKKSESCGDMGPGSFQISPDVGCQPLLVFVNPKSGGRQGAKLYRKFLYHLNPRQVYNLANGGPGPGLQMFREVENVIIVVCGGDGTVGWVLETLGRSNIMSNKSNHNKISNVYNNALSFLRQHPILFLIDEAL